MSVSHTPQTQKIEPWSDWDAFEATRPKGNLLDPLCQHCLINHIPEQKFMCTDCASYYEKEQLKAEIAEADRQEELYGWLSQENYYLDQQIESGSWMSDTR